VCNIPTYGTASVARAFALILELTVNAKLHSDAARPRVVGIKVGASGKLRSRDWKEKRWELWASGELGGVPKWGMHSGWSFWRDAVQTNPPPYQGFRFVTLEDLLHAPTSCPCTVRYSPRRRA
jgi:hypothetical protein